MFGLFDKADVNIKIPNQVIMEDEIECIVEIFPKSETKLRKIEIELYCQETAIFRGTTSRYYHNKVHSDLRFPANETVLQPDSPLTIKALFVLPPFTTPTILTHNHRVEWFFRVRLDVPWWPDTRAEKQIVVHPCMLTTEIF